jgi:hypothetical protein
MRDPVVTAQEFVASLKRSSLPTVVIEGEDDTVVYRKIEQIYGPLSISIIPVGGRDAVLEIFRSKSDIGNHVLFIADKDNWCVTNVPDEYLSDCLIFTDGYSVENDIILDGELPKLFSKEEQDKFGEELEAFLHWYALALSRHLETEGTAIKCHPNEILGNKDRDQMLALRSTETYPESLRSMLASDPYRLVRGKSIFALIMRQLSYKGRKPRHHHLSLMETVAINPGPRIARIFNEVEKYFELKHLTATA